MNQFKEFMFNNLEWVGDHSNDSLWSLMYRENRLNNVFINIMIFETAFEKQELDETDYNI